MIRNVELFINGSKADFYGDENIELTDSIQNIRDIGKVFTSFSKQFTLPASSRNNQIFKHYYNPDIVDGFDARFLVSAEIKIDGFNFKKGRIRLNGVNMSSNHPKDYKVVFFGELSDLSATFGEDKLSSLSYLSRYNHAYSLARVKDGLEAGLEYSVGSMVRSSFGDVVYPLISHTKRYIYDTSFKDLNGVALDYTQLKPSLKIKNIVDAIEDRYGITFSSAFFDSGIFSNIYMWLHRASSGVVNKDEAINSISFSDWSYSSGVATYTDPLVATYKISRLYTKYRLTYNFIVSGSGKHDITIINDLDGEILYESIGVEGNHTVILNLETTNPEKKFSPKVKIVSAPTISSYNVNLEVTHIKKLAVFNPETEESGNYAITSLTTVSKIDIQSQMPDMRVIDFLTSLFKMFNLTAYVKDDGSIYVEPLETFYSQGVEYDVTAFTDISNSEINRYFDYREISFEYEEPKNFLTKQRNDIIQEEFGNLEYTLQDSVDGGKYEIKVGFEKLLFDKLIDQSDESYTSLLFGWMVDEGESPTVGSPILMYRNGSTNATKPITWTDASTSGSYIRMSNGSIPNGLSLNFNAEIDEFDLVTNNDSLFSNYYKDYIESVFDYRARLFRTTIYLPLHVLLNYNMNDRLIISGRKYRINEIDIDLSTGKAEVELLNELP